MKNIFLKRKLIISALILALTLSVFALPTLADYPKAESYVADAAGVLAESTVRFIKKNNDTMKKDYEAVVAVCTVKSTGEMSISEYARNVFSKWKMGDGVLLLIASDDRDYYFVQSTGLENIMTNEQLQAVRNDYLEPDFATGNIDRGVNKSVTKLTSIIQSGIQKKNAEAAADEENDAEGTTAGKVIVTILKILLYTALVLVILFIALFVTAMFNDDVAALMRKYVFERGKKNNYRIPEEYYDERLYGGRAQPQSNRRERPNPAQRNGYGGERGELPRQNRRSMPHQNGYNQLNENRMPRSDVYYNADGTVRRRGNSAPSDSYQANPRQNAYKAGGGQHRISEADETRQFNIPTRRS